MKCQDTEKCEDESIGWSLISNVPGQAVVLYNPSPPVQHGGTITGNNLKCNCFNKNLLVLIGFDIKIYIFG